MRAAMHVLRTLPGLPALPRPILSIGNFDGVHRAHQKVLRRVVERAQARRGTALALTFDPHPTKILAPAQAPPLLTTLEQRLGCLEELGIEWVVVLPFTQELSRLSPREFARQILVERLHAEWVLIGVNFRFGHRQAGDAGLLVELGRELGFGVEAISPVVVGGSTVSSSLIRERIQSGEVSDAARLLGRPFALTGEVEPGAGRGRELSFPTLNLVPEQECLPARGVYVTEVRLGGEEFPAATNVGVRPTFDGSRLLVESHLLDFSRTVAAGRVEVRFHERLREERRFPSPEALRAEIERDVESTRRFFRRRRTPKPGRAGPVAAPG